MANNSNNNDVDTRIETRGETFDTSANDDIDAHIEARGETFDTRKEPKKGFKHYWGKSVKGMKKAWNIGASGMNLIGKKKGVLDRKLYGTSPFWFFILCLIFHLIDVSTGFNEASLRLGMYIVLAIVGWLVVFRTEPGVLDIANLKSPLILSTIAFVVPYLGNVLPFLQGSQAYQTVIIFFPVWIIHLVFVIDGTKFLKFMQFVIIVILLLLFLPSFIINISADLQFRDIQTGIDVQETMTNGLRDMGHNFGKFWGNLKAIPGQLWDEVFVKPMRYATGDYYTGKVDEYEHEPVGVYLENLEAADSKFFEGEKITVWAVLKTKTLDNEININVSCYAEEGDKKIKGDITPQNEFNIAGEEEVYLDCVFDKLNPGKKDVTFNAEFSFETMSYLKTYFMDKDKLRAFNRDGIDVFSHYKISHRNPIAIYTNGPIGIGMRTSDLLPVGIYSDKDNIPFFFGITIENNWDGVIKNVTDLEIQVHDSLKLTNCDHQFKFKESNEDGYNVYNLVPDVRTENIMARKFHSIKCRLNPDDPKSLLGNEPITTRYFRVTARYIYELEKSTPVEIEEVKDYVSPEEAMTSYEDMQELNEKINKGEVCNPDVISECSDYDENNYDRLGFSDQAWCDDDPCELMCYPSFKEDEAVVYYDSCEKCPYYYSTQGIPVEDYCNIYLNEDYCKKDSCDFWNKYYFKCEWMEDVTLCKGIIASKSEEIEDWEKYSDEDKEKEIKVKVKEASSEIGVPEEIALAVAFIESGFNQDRTGGDGEIGVMQVIYEQVNQKGKSYCQMYCDFVESEDDLYNLNNNIKCGLTILNNLHEYYMHHPSEFRENVEICDNPVFKDKYLSYVNKGAYASNWDMALRAYNGFGCQNEKVAGYVEDVMERAQIFKNQ